MSRMVERLGGIWHRWIGSSSVFSLETRIFHSICIGLVLLALVYAPYNFFLELYIAGISAIVVAGIFYFQYYNSRFRGKSYSATLFAITGIVIFPVNYFVNSGITGSTDLIWPSYLLLVLAIAPYRHHLLWVGVYIIAFFVVHLIEYKYPSLVQHPFKAGWKMFIDRVTSFPMPVIATAITIIFVRRSYDKERTAVDEKAAAVELANRKIIEQKNQLQESDAEKNKLLSIISHDMRAPFTHIQGYLQLLSQIEIGTEERLELERELLNATDQTIEMLSNLLYWSRSQMEGVAVHLVQTDLMAVLGKTLEIEKALAARKNIRLDYAIDDDIGVMADVNMLQLVLRNIVNNAVKFTPQGGRIDIHALKLANECKIVVRDNGMGIEYDKQGMLFSLTSGSTFGTNNEKGVGLGLPLCKEFMERQGGYLDFESTPGQGSAFYIFIPLAAKGTPG